MDDIRITSPARGVVVVELQGEHDCFTESDLARLLAEEVATNDLVILDVSDALLIDSSVIHNVIQADLAATARNSRFVLQLGTAPIVRRALETSGVLSYLDVALSREEALGRQTAADRGGWSGAASGH